MIKDVIFICGLGGDAGMTYVQSLKDFCEKKGFNFYAPHMPSYEDVITYDKYKASFENLLKQQNIKDFENVLIIAQSAGTNFIVKYLANSPLNLGGYISCSGFSGEADRGLSKETKERLSVLNSFFPTEQEYKKFKEMNFKKYSIFGGKDCFFTTNNLSKYAELIGAEKIFDKNGVHCTISENVKTHKLLHSVIEQNF